MSDLTRLEAELQNDPAQVDLILSQPDVFPAVQEDPERVIECSPANLQRALCRQIARCREWGEFWETRIEEPQLCQQ